MVLALASRWSGSRERANRLFSDVATKLPVLLPATVTLGVAPLLFLQVIYGQFFYTSSVLIAWPWFLVLVMLTIAYYGLYYVSARTHRQAGSGRWVLLASFLLIAVIGFLFSTNLTLSQTPSAWAGKYFAESQRLEPESRRTHAGAAVPAFLYGRSRCGRTAAHADRLAPAE